MTPRELVSDAPADDQQQVSAAPSHVSPEAWAPRGDRLGVYLHLPFCVERCGYCSFNTAPYTPQAMDRFLAALLGEIDLVARAPWSRSITVRSVFVGGGTPSLATPEAMAAILARLGARFAVEPGAEVTVECNPESVSCERLAGYRRAGVNRISLGVQSLDDRILPTLGRLHSAREAREAFDAARAAGFDNISADLIYGLPELDTDTWETTVREVIEWEPDHLSAYALALDEGSLWHAAGVKGLPGEDIVADQYRRLVQAAGEAGYEHYEISNYARPGRRSAHNQVYWRAEEYLALGPGAAGFLGDVRYVNVKPVERYCALAEAAQLPVGSHETLTARQRLAERLILGLRTCDGIPRAWIEERIALEAGRLPERLMAWKERKLLVEQGSRVRLTEAGFLLSDALFVELL
ncbi:MAG TPA: radical SAM family heme chaperone HemW [Gemmatimonadales bacterium]|nr:radical SAM family heme chaperone HemW [Gemmatimonadales bacterium]